MFSLVPLAIFSITVLAPLHPIEAFASTQDSRCQAVLVEKGASPGALARALWLRLLAGRSPKAKLDLEKLQAKKAVYIERLSAGHELTDDIATEATPENIFALIEAASAHSGFDAFHLTDAYEYANEGDRKSIVKRLAKIDLRKGIRPSQALDLVTDLYILSKRGLVPFGTGLKRLAPKSIQERIRERVEIEIATHDLVTAAKNLGLLREGGMLEKLSQWDQRHANVRALIGTAALNLFTMIHFGVPLGPPMIQTLGERALTPELIQKVREHGFEAAYDDLKARFGNFARFDFAWSVSMRSARALTSSYFLVALLSVAPTAVQFFRMSHVSKDDLAQLQEKTFDPEAIRREQFESWKEAFQTFNGRMPDPEKYPEDRDEWDKTLKNLRSIPDEQLKIDFKAH